MNFRTMHAKSNNIEIIKGNETDEITEELFESPFKKYLKGLEEKISGSEFGFDSVVFLHYNLDKISLDRSRSYIDSPKCLNNKKATINPKNNNDKCFQYTVTVVLNYEQNE